MKPAELTPEQLARELIARGLKRGADEIEVSVTESTHSEVEIRKGAVEQLNRAQDRGIYIRVFKQQRTATASSFDCSLETLDRLLYDALSRAERSHTDPYAGLAEKFPEPVSPEVLEIFDPALIAFPVKEQIKRARRLEKISMGMAPNLRSHGSFFVTETGSFLLANSNGFSKSFPFSFCECGLYLQGGAGDQTIDDGWWSKARYLNDLENAENIAGTAVDRVTRLLGARRVPSSRVPLIFEPLPAASLLAFLAACLDGDLIYLKDSFLAGALSTTIAPPTVTVRDNPHLPRALGSRSFDGDGIACSPRSIIDKGVLTSYLLDVYSARKLGLTSTGHRNGPTNFYLEAGASTPQEIIASVDRGFLVTNVLGQGLNPASGDISRGAMGLWIEDGVPAYPVTEVTFSGNLADILKDIVLIGNDLVLNRSIVSPTILVENMTLGGT